MSSLRSDDTDEGAKQQHQQHQQQQGPSGQLKQVNNFVDVRGSVGMHGSLGVANGGSLGMDAATLQRRIIALGIPPLPPAFVKPGHVVKKPGHAYVTGAGAGPGDSPGMAGSAAGKGGSSGPALTPQQQMEFAAQAARGALCHRRGR